jgi:hypothetical protein
MPLKAEPVQQERNFSVSLETFHVIRAEVRALTLQAETSSISDNAALERNEWRKFRPRDKARIIARRTTRIKNVGRAGQNRWLSEAFWKRHEFLVKRPKLSDPSGGTRGLQPQRDSRFAAAHG